MIILILELVPGVHDNREMTLHPVQPLPTPLQAAPLPAGWKQWAKYEVQNLQHLCGDPRGPSRPSGAKIARHREDIAGVRASYRGCLGDKTSLNFERRDAEEERANVSGVSYERPRAPRRNDKGHLRGSAHARV